MKMMGRGRCPRPENQAVSVLSAAEAVAEGTPVANDGIGAEFRVVIDQIHSDFRTHEDVVPDVGANTSAKITHEVIAARVGRASEKIVAVDEPVEANVLAADSGQQFRREILGESWRPDGVKGVEKGPVGLRSAIESLAGPPGELPFDADAMAKQEVSAECRISAAIIGGEVQTILNGGCRGSDGAHAEGSIELLRLGGRGKESSSNYNQQNT